MSLSIKKSIVTSRTHLKNRLDEAVKLISLALPSSISELEKFRDDFFKSVELLERSIKKIQDSESQWFEVINRIKDAESKKLESDAYAEASTGDGGFLMFVEHAEDCIASLHSRVRQVDREISRRSSPAPTTPTPAATPSTSAANISPAPAAPKIFTAKPPKLTIPDFDGNILKWKYFWGIFKANIHDHPEFSGVIKLSYLLPLLKGPAKDAVDGLIISDEAYPAAVQMLMQRFDRTDDRMMSLLFGEFKKMSTATHGCVQTRKVHDSCEAIFHQMQNLGEDVDMSRTMSLDYLSKFSDTVFRHLERDYGISGHSKLGEIRSAVQKYVTKWEVTTGTLQDLHAIAGTRSSAGGADKKGPPKLGQKGPSGSCGAQGQDGSEHDTSLGTLGRHGVQPCAFCNGKHYSSKCFAFPTLKDRLSRLKELGRCERCTGLPHQNGKCFMSDKTCKFCQKVGHVWILCPKRDPPNHHPNKTPDQKTQKGQKKVGFKGILKGQQSGDEEQSDVSCASLGATSLFQTAKVRVVNPDSGKHAILRVCIDTLSGRSYMTNGAVETLGLKSSQTSKLFVSVFGSEKRKEVPTRIVTFEIRQRDGSIKTLVANTTKLITGSSVLPSVWPKSDWEVVNSLKSSGSLADDPFDPDGTVDILIGADYAWDFILGAKIRSSDNIFLIPTTLGMMLAGKLTSDTDGRNEDVATVCMLSLSDVSAHIPSDVVCASQDDGDMLGSYDKDMLMKLENIGIYDCPFTDDDEVALKKFSDTVYYDKGRYHVTWPFIDGKREVLPTNKGVAEKRFRMLTKRLQAQPKLLETYRSVIKQQRDCGVVECVPERELDREAGVHYLPHHPFVDLNRASTKVRVVYDASSRPKRSDVSLNECMYKGPTMLPDLCQLLIRFRLQPIAITSDVEKAFLQVALQATERDYTRFLWFRDDQKLSFAKENVAEFRFCRVLFGVISSPFLLAATIQHHLKQDGTEFAMSLSDDIYVDNVISGTSDEKLASEYYQKAKSLFKRAGMNLQQFYSNSATVMGKIPAEDKWTTETVKVLGLQWCGERDTICVKMSTKWNRYPKCTKRVILMTVASIYDPLGLFQPAVFPAKVLLQKLWIKGVAWDTEISGELADQWHTVKHSLLSVFDHQMPRFCCSPSHGSILVTFCDASKDGYGAVVYLHVPTSDGKSAVQLLLSKSRLSPIDRKGVERRVTIPRLELLAVEVGCRITDFCRQAIRNPDMSSVIFTDSMVAIHWLRMVDLTSLKRFVSNRIEKIRAFDHMQFRHVGTTENPADMLSRGVSSSELINSDLWWTGPTWLRKPESDWPSHEPQITDSVSAEVNSETRATTEVLVAVEPEVETDTPFDIDPGMFSSWNGLLYRTAVCLIALQQLSAGKYWPDGSIFHEVSRQMPPRAADIEAAEKLWIKWSQVQSFSKILMNTGMKDLVQQLGLVKDRDGIIRSAGRLGKSDLPENQRCPVLISSKSPIAVMIVFRAHADAGHAGETHTLAQLQLKFWVPKGRSFVRQVIRKCLICRRRKSKQVFRLPEMPQLPQERVSRSMVFQYVGLDYFGPMKVKIGDKIHKMWVSLFTCLATRAIHLEPVYDCSTFEFMHAFIRFGSRRGYPHQIISDNAAQFKLTDILKDRAWKRLPTDESLLRYAANHGTRWKFIAELAPWQGGHYERLVGVVKSVLRVAVGRRLLNWTDIVTLLCETEAIVNSRPITYVPSDVDAQGKVLRPVDFLTPLDTGIGLSDTDFPVRDLGEAAKHLAAAWKKRKIYLDRLWNTWYGEYLSVLRNRSQSIHRQSRSNVNRSPREGEVVILKDDDLPRGSWKLAVVTKLFPSADGLVRSAEIKLGNGIKLNRAVNFLIPLEISNDAEIESLIDPVGDGFSDNDEFLGFTPSDIRRTERLLNAHDE